MSPSSRRGPTEPPERPRRREIPGSDPGPGAGEGTGDRDESLDYSGTGAGGPEVRMPPAISAPYGRIGAGAGIAYALVGLLGLSLLPIGGVSPEDSAAEVASRLAADRGRVSAGIFLTLFGVLFLLVFISWLHRWLRQAEGDGGWLATLAFGGGLLLIGALLIVLSLSVATSVLESYGDDPVIARTLLVLQWQALAIVFMPASAYVGATALVGWRSGWLPRWLCYAGMGLAVGMLVAPLGFVPFLLSTLWTGLLAVVLLQQGRALR